MSDWENEDLEPNDNNEGGKKIDLMNSTMNQR